MARVKNRYLPLVVEHIMVRLRENFGWTFLLIAVLWLTALDASAQVTTPAQTTPAGAQGAPQGAARAARAHQPRQHPRKTGAIEPDPAPAPPPPQTPEQMAPTPPHVTYQNGMLSVDAKNSTLSQVLRSVQVQTGASVEMPASASSERVMMQLGPGRPRDVLNTLLNGSKFNYIILGMTGDPGAVQKVILTTRQSAVTAVNTAQNSAPGQAQQQYPPPEEQQEEEVSPAETEVESQPEAPQVPPPPGRFRPGQNIPMRNQEGNDQPPENANPKTPEQLLQELQMMQQQQQQYQQQLNPANVEGQPPQ